jgi:predicted phosphodiesterase
METKVSTLMGAGDFKEIARELGVTDRTVTLVATKLRNERMAELALEAQNVQKGAEPIRVLELENEKIRKAFSRDWKPPLRIAVASDLHFPFYSPKAVDDLLAAPGKFDFLLLVGDVYDMYHFSTFRKETSIPFSREFQESLPIWNKLVKKFGEVIYIAGSNHERRLWMRLIERADDFTAGLEQGAKNILYEAIDKIRDFYLNRDAEHVTAYYGWWLRFGNVIFAHPDRFLRRTMGTAEEVSKYFMNRYIDFETLMVAHTHRLSGFSPVMGKWLAEIPAMCTPMDYMADGHAKVGSLHNGHAIVCIGPDGRLDYNNSRIHFSGVWGGRKLITTMGGIE